MSKAEDFLKTWILNNVAPITTRGSETRARAQKLAEMFTLAAIQLGIDKEDPVLDPQELYERMIAAIEEARPHLDVKE